MLVNQNIQLFYLKNEILLKIGCTNPLKAASISGFDLFKIA